MQDLAWLEHEYLHNHIQKRDKKREACYSELIKGQELPYLGEVTSGLVSIPPSRLDGSVGEFSPTSCTDELRAY